VKIGSAINRSKWSFLLTGVVLLVTATALTANVEVLAVQLDEITVTSTRFEDEQVRMGF